MNPASDSELRHQRSELKEQGRFAEAIPIQKRILANAQQSGCIRDISNAWNMLSHLLQMNKQFGEAETAARHALAVYDEDKNQSLETLANYEMKLAMILAAQHRFSEAAQYGNQALEHFADFHDPPDEFLRLSKKEVAQMVELSKNSRG
ncbi:tetratricopeptide repeat protein [Calycomorphotria hydatis]|uniref:Tetratricopeptide repeat protein n=1 Tax=Calycomorphotria hydatis TaxID=2528027 RepID=A0A517T5N3_9PLAN|nr:tetratricopeptide repeat protein [Calycomorphotria hydatis]QDT63692.1 Tetratricopeptide repeat protein [Calycomorphotria hydatis]